MRFSPGRKFTSERTLDSSELGTVVKVNGKVRWDGGQTNYYRHGEQANVRLRELRELRCALA